MINKFQKSCVVREDFVVHRSQIYRARAAGADTILLIVSCFVKNEKRLKSFIKVAFQIPFGKVTFLRSADRKAWSHW